jgi:hypothetical protein
VSDPLTSLLRQHAAALELRAAWHARRADDAAGPEADELRRHALADSITRLVLEGLVDVLLDVAKQLDGEEDERAEPLTDDWDDAA